MVNGKAQLMRDDYCDGLGDCLPTCPTAAITFVEREAAAYDEKAVEENKRRRLQEKMQTEGMTLPCGCPGSQSRTIAHEESAAACNTEAVSRLSQWPVQIKLVPARAPYFDCRRLHRVCLCRLPRKIHQGTYHPCGLSEAGQCGLFRKADRNHS